jgi:UDP-N-acetylmuramoylalanine--D-glutamate ligase
VSLLGEGLKSFDANGFVGGNLGVPFCDYAIGVLQGKPRAKWVVLELSSYQLENCANLQLEHSIITFLSANHLERYESLADYYATKMKITDITSGVCLFNANSADCAVYAAKSKAQSRLVCSKSFARKKLLDEIALIGNHNKDNFSLAAEMAELCSWPEVAVNRMAAYPGLSHRLEFVGSVDGVTYINDSKATAMDSVLVAARGCLEGLTGESRLFLLLGGKDKNLPWEDLSVLSSHERIEPVFFGACGALAKEKSQLAGEVFAQLGAAITFCQNRSRPGDVVLLSPGGTSLDEFRNFEERGDFFRTLVLVSGEK